MKPKKPLSPVLEIDHSRKAEKTTTSSTSKNPVALKQSSGLKYREFRTPTAILRRLDIDPVEVECAPRITESLASCFGITKNRSLHDAVVGYLSGSTAPSALAFMESWRSIRKADIERLSIEAVCVHASVDPREVFGAVLMAAKSIKTQESALKAILAHPD